MAEEVPKLERDNTMVATAKVLTISTCLNRHVKAAILHFTLSSCILSSGRGSLSRREGPRRRGRKDQSTAEGDWRNYNDRRAKWFETNNNDGRNRKGLCLRRFVSFVQCTLSRILHGERLSRVWFELQTNYSAFRSSTELFYQICLRLRMVLYRIMQ
jgi:hypothetical protein